MKKAIIIGASSGIGRELARVLITNNYKTGITGRRTELLQELKNEAPEMYICKTIDITELATLEGKLKELISELGGLDLLVLSAGIGDLNENLDYTIEQSVIHTNISAWTYLAGWSFNYFIKQKYGHFVSISSIAGLRGNRVAPSYNATKAYQINYTEGLRQKANNLKLPIFVTDIRPGLVDTAMAKTSSRSWIVPAKKAALQIYNAIKNKNKIAYVSKRWKIFAWILKLIPRSIYSNF